jgi:TPR repeat protein
MGMMWSHGIGVGPDLQKAAEYYAKGCTPTSASGCGELGQLYERGAGGLKKDLARAEQEYTRACETAADSMACRWLADLLTAGGKAKPARIAALYHKAYEMTTELAEQTAYGKYNLGTLYRDGIAVARNPAKAAEQFAAACDGYDPLGCLEAGKMYLGDQGIPANYEEAKVRFERACIAGLDAGCTGAATAKAKLGGGGGRTGPGPDPIKKKGTCACEGGVDPAGLLLLFAVAALLFRRRAVR